MSRDDRTTSRKTGSPAAIPIKRSGGHAAGQVEEERRRTIEEAAYAVLSQVGYRRTSMLAVAKRARASNQTLYRWYGSKQGLFRALIQRNAEEAVNALRMSDHCNLHARMHAFGETLLRMLTGEKAIALNRAAAADASETGELGQELACSGRGRIVPLLRTTFETAKLAGEIDLESIDEAVERYVALLIGDLQVRRVTGSLPPLTAEEIKKRAVDAWRVLQKSSSAVSQHDQHS